MADVNKIHVNSSTKISLNDRFTVMSKIDPKSFSNINQMKVNRNENNINTRTNAKSSIANRILLQQLSRKHHTLAALKLKRRSLKPSNRNYTGRGIRRTSIQTLTEGRANSKTNKPTMKAVIRNRSLRRSKFALNQHIIERQSKMGHNHSIESIKKLRKRRDSVSGNTSYSKFNDRQQNNRNRANSISRQSAVPRSNSRVDLNRLRSRSRSNIRMPGLQTNRSSSMKDNSRTRRRSVSNSRVSNPGPSIIHRLGVNHNKRLASNRLQNRSRIGQINKRGNYFLTKSNTTQTKFKRGRVGANSADRARGRSRNRTRGRFNTSKKSIQNQNKSQNQYIIRSPSRNSNIRRGRGPSMKLQRNSANFETTHRGRSRARRTNNGSNSSRRGSVKKEDLDKELDQYMANSEI